MCKWWQEYIKSLTSIEPQASHKCFVSEEPTPINSPSLSYPTTSISGFGKLIPIQLSKLMAGLFFVAGECILMLKSLPKNLVVLTKGISTNKTELSMLFS
ncbi:ORF373 [White spot syndrome virus]|uniref:Wsv344 n=3 Tax=White spot syndrome virus TaxID=342409 RepID=Q8VAQ7_WSSVS|nr:wsv344 [Shrimp white spot syndrome virus]AFX59721.1 wsv344 [White spot syndrome virus]AAL33346.1 wsv344 [Shrimp white spot syndrome virus]AAL89268.1 WSSV400 [Shrimp white spot syndrome virus]ATU83660.1 ORF373 [White spot syndrome virus]AWQ60473.1 wsv344 [Shrimp white spot syndrome virus]